MPTHTISSVHVRRSRRTYLTSLFFAAALSALAACGGGGDAAPTTPLPSDDGSGGGGGGGGGSAQATLTVTNQTASHTASFVRTRGCGGGTWGDDLLGGADYLDKGETLSANLAPGCYDVRVTPKESDVTFLYFYGVQLTAGEIQALTFTAFPPK